MTATAERRNRLQRVEASQLAAAAVPAQAAEVSRTLEAANLTELRALRPSGNTSVVLAGRSSRGDGGGGTFVYDPSDTQTADSPLCYVTSGGHRLKRVYSGPIDVRWFGAKGDGVTDDTAAIQAAIDAAETTGQDVLVPAGTYKVASTLAIVGASGVAVRGVGIKTVIAPTTALAGLPVFRLSNCRHCGVSDMRINGNSGGAPSCAWESRVVNPVTQAPKGNFIERVLIGSDSASSFVDGVRFSCDPGYDQNNDQGKVINVDVQNATGAGVAILHDNSVWHEIRGGSISAAKGVYLAGGSFSMFGTSLNCSVVNFEFTAPANAYEHPSFVSASASESGAKMVSVDNVSQVRFFLTNFTHKGGVSNSTPVLFRSYFGRLSMVGCDLGFGQPNVTCTVDGDQCFVSFVDCSLGFTHYVATAATSKIRRRDPRHYPGNVSDSGAGSIVETT